MSSNPANVSESEARTARPTPRRIFLGTLVLGLVNVACSSTTQRTVKSAKRKKYFDAVELFPADLDLVLRVDLARMRVALGPMAQSLSSKVSADLKLDDALMLRALEHARVAWIGTRIADLESGDRVLIVEGDVEDIRPDADTFTELDPPLMEGVRSFERRGPLARDATARIHLLGSQTILFTTGVEVDGVERVLMRGPDPGRRDPRAEGIVSADLRGRRLPSRFERKFPSIGSIARGVKRVQASVTLVDDQVHADFEVATNSSTESTKLAKFLNALREGGQAGRYAVFFDGLHVERVEQAVQIKWVARVDLLRDVVAQ